MAGVVDCWTKGPGVQVQVAENVVSLGDRHGPVIRLSSQRVLTDEQCVALCEQILSTTAGGGADLHVNRYQDERKFALEPRGAASRHVCVFFDFSRGSGKVKTMA